MGSKLSHGVLQGILGQATGKVLLFEEPVEQAVDKPAALLTAKFFRQLDGFIDDHELWNVVLVKHLEDRQPKDIPVDGRHTLETPIICLKTDQIIDLAAVLQSSRDQILRVFEGLVRQPAVVAQIASPAFSSRLPVQVYLEIESVEDLPGAAAAEISLIQHLDSDLPGGSPLADHFINPKI